jgi:carbon-monoxide dehydrogenase large subunit
LHDGVPNNLALDYVYGDQEKAERAFSEAAHVVRVDLRAQRIAGNPIEPKSCVARYDAAADTFEICVPSRGWRRSRPGGR